MVRIYCLSLGVPKEALSLMESALEGFGGALATGMPDSTGKVRLDLYLGEKPATAEVTARLAAAALAAGVPVPAFTLELMPDIDWVAETQAGLPPLRAGRFYVYGSHVAARPPRSSLPLLVDASVAFGTGRHQTTRACLLALDRLARRFRPRRVLDLGCGSGILAMAMARLWPGASVWASDNDPHAVRVAGSNARVNALAGRIRVLKSDGYKAARLSQARPFDLIVANILAGPLCDMAGEAARHLRPGGRLLLSGLLVRQEGRVLARHRVHGLFLENRQHVDGWSALLLRRGGGAGD